MSDTFEYNGKVLRYADMSEEQNNLFQMLVNIEKKIPELQSEISIMEAAKEKIGEKIDRSLW